MGRVKLQISKKELEGLYWNKNLSTYKIADLLNCSFKTIINRLREYRIIRKTSSFARNRYFKNDFDNNLITKAYMVGFRLGDLNVYRPNQNSETIVVRCHTTKKEQSYLIRSLFENFGQVSVSKNKNHCNINCFLNNSFSFLLPKNNWGWVKKDFKFSRSFTAGYVDAEGSFLVYESRARFKIDSYDFSILDWISKWLSMNKINNIFRKIATKGDYVYRSNIRWKNNLWRLQIGEAGSLEKFIKLILPFLRHKKRIRDAKSCFKNIKLRRINGTIK